MRYDAFLSLLDFKGLNNNIHYPHSLCLGFVSTSKINVIFLPLACVLKGKNNCFLTELQITLQI